MTSCVMCNLRKHREINCFDQCIILKISHNLDCLDKTEVTSSEPKEYMGILGKGLVTSFSVKTKRSNEKEKARFGITDITNQDFREAIKKFENSP